MKKALIVVDVQNDFLDGGALEVPEGIAVIPIINSLSQSEKFDLVVATQDWHPANHGSFAANHPGKKVGEVIDLNGLNQILWPVHCVQGSEGARLHADLEKTSFAKIFEKGTDPEIDSYSGFFDNGHRKATGLGDYLKDQGVTDVYITGLAADYCVKFTALDARELGFNTFLFSDATRGVNLQPDDTQNAFADLESKGISLLNSKNF